MDTKIITFGWVSLILYMHISWNTVAWFLRPMSEELCREKPSIWCFMEAHWSVFLLLPQINRLHQNVLWKAFPDTILRSSVAKIKRNLKMTVFQEVGIDSKLLNLSTKFNDLGIILFCGTCFIYIMMCFFCVCFFFVFFFLAHKVLKIRRSTFMGHPV